MESPPPVISPLVTSALRFLFISVLVLCNGSACWKVASGKRQITGHSRRSSQIIICTVLCVNLLYLCLVWAPFTLQALSHDVHGLQKAFGDDSQQETLHATFVLEEGLVKGVIKEEITFTSSAKFVSDARGQTLDDNQHKMRRDLSDAKRSEWSAIFDGARREAGAQDGHPHRLSLTEAVEKSVGSGLSWGSGSQDLITSSCAYAIAFTAVMKTAIQRMHVIFPGGSWALGGIVGVMVSVPTALTLTLRLLASGSHFAEHEIELTSSGYITFYNIICDVHITESYVVSLFLEWAALLTLVLVATGLLLICRLRTQSFKLHQEEQDEQESRGIEDWARDIVLVIGAAWAWPVKPAMVLVLYCTYGPHWTNLVCWLSHLVVSIPVVFLPLAVFLNRTSDNSTDKEQQHVVLTQKHQSSTTHEEINSQKTNIITESKASDKSKSKSVSKESKLENSNIDNTKDARDNLKFYLGKDIFKSKEENLSDNPAGNNIRLKNESAHPSFSDV